MARASSLFHALPEPSAEEVAQVAEWTHASLVRVLARHGRSLDGVEDAPDRLRDEEPALASCYAASAADVQLLGEAPGQRTSKLVRPLRVVPSPTEPVAEVGGRQCSCKGGVRRPGPRAARAALPLRGPAPALAGAAVDASRRAREAELQSGVEGRHARGPARSLARYFASAGSARSSRRRAFT